MNRRRLGHSKAVAARGEHRRRLPEWGAEADGPL